MAVKAKYNDSVFINCPFDEQYNPLLKAIVFAVYRCGFLPVTALGEDNALDNRLVKIENCIEKCRYGIHDISRTDLNVNNLPRFNMPFELGIFFGAKHFGDKSQKNKNALIFDVARYRYQEFISDLNGIDIKAHNSNPLEAIQRVRNWLSISSRRNTIPGNITIVNAYNEFLVKLPAIVETLELDIDNLQFNDYCLIVEETLNTIFRL